MSIVRKSRRIIQKAIARGWYRTLSCVGDTDFQKFIILSRSRTGSNLLRSLLRSHPKIEVDKEILSRLGGQNHRDIVAKAFGKQPSFIQAKGFKFFYYHPQDGDARAVWDDLLRLKDLRVLHLKRRNILRTLVSRKLAGSQEMWGAYHRNDLQKAKQKQRQVSFTAEELQEGFEQTRDWEREGDERFRNHPVMDVYYEDLISDRQSVFAEIVAFLDLPYAEPETGLIRQNPESLKDLVTNYKELKDAFAGSAWESFFEE